MPPEIDVCMVLFCNQVERAAAPAKEEPADAADIGKLYSKTAGLKVMLGIRGGVRRHQ